MHIESFIALSAAQDIKPHVIPPPTMTYLWHPDSLSYSKNVADVCARDGWKTPPVNGLSSSSGAAVTLQ